MYTFAHPNQFPFHFNRSSNDKTIIHIQNVSWALQLDVLLFFDRFTRSMLAEFKKENCLCRRRLCGIALEIRFFFNFFLPFFRVRIGGAGRFFRQTAHQT